jgi:hypothetical protein
MLVRTGVKLTDRTKSGVCIQPRQAVPAINSSAAKTNSNPDSIKPE